MPPILDSNSSKDLFKANNGHHQSESDRGGTMGGLANAGAEEDNTVGLHD